MLRTIALAASVAILAAGCGKKEPSKAQPPHGGSSPVGQPTPAGTTNPGKPSSTDDPQKPPTDVDSGSKGGWIPVAVPEEMKNQDYGTVLHLVKVKDTVAVINLDRYMVGRTDHGSGTGSSLTAANLIEPKTSWEIVGGGIMDKMKAAADKTDVFVRIQGKRTMDKKFVSPPGTAGEKHDWTVTVEKVVWEKSETAYTHEVTILEEEMWDMYLATIEGTLDLASAVTTWRKFNETAYDLGLNLGDRDRDRTKKPLEGLVNALDRIAANQAVLDRKPGGVEEATAWLKNLLEWSHFPPSPVGGDVENDEREKRARQSLTNKVTLIENGLRDRLKTGGLEIAPSDAAKLLASTDGTMMQKFAIFAAEAGKGHLSAEAVIAVFHSGEKSDWKQTTLSLFKNSVTSTPSYFAGWPADALSAFPGRFKDAVLPFTKGQLIPTRNAMAVIEAVRKSAGGQTFTPSLDEIISELKKK